MVVLFSQNWSRFPVSHSELRCFWGRADWQLLPWGETVFRCSASWQPWLWPWCGNFIALASTHFLLFFTNTIIICFLCCWWRQRRTNAEVRLTFPYLLSNLLFVQLLLLPQDKNAQIPALSTLTRTSTLITGVQVMIQEKLWTVLLTNPRWSTEKS